tara:strand:+ start:1584 stop:1760 length:177 start_codon:yes stop_codon:yes gene_type:complete
LQVGHTAIAEPRFINMQMRTRWFVGSDASMQPDGLRNDLAPRRFALDMRPNSPEELAA